MTEENISIELDQASLASVNVTIPMNWVGDWDQWESVAFSAMRPPISAKFRTEAGQEFTLTDETFELWEVLDGSYCIIVPGYHSDAEPTIIELGFEND